mmetsp:Transcript_15648/g.43896  ORF Transcript_15648/g.43896 Transcript_15648/m.43896 type:complete len:236 (-) Transcript_15648:788-1495(-)
MMVSPKRAESWAREGRGAHPSNPITALFQVVHWHLPSSFEALYQEAGRAARDGLPAQALLYYSDEDVDLVRFILRKGAESGCRDCATSASDVAVSASSDAANNERHVGRSGARTASTAGSSAQRILERRLSALDAVIGYCTQRRGCRRATLLAHFGEEPIRGGIPSAMEGQGQPRHLASAGHAPAAKATSACCARTAGSPSEGSRSGCCDLCKDQKTVAGMRPRTMLSSQHCEPT